jgi:hypothetical protein
MAADLQYDGGVSSRSARWSHTTVAQCCLPFWVGVWQNAVVWHGLAVAAVAVSTHRLQAVVSISRLSWEFGTISRWGRGYAPTNSSVASWIDGRALGHSKYWVVFDVAALRVFLCSKPVYRTHPVSVSPCIAWTPPFAELWLLGYSHRSSLKVIPRSESWCASMSRSGLWIEQHFILDGAVWAKLIARTDGSQRIHLTNHWTSINERRE